MSQKNKKNETNSKSESGKSTALNSRDAILLLSNLFTREKFSLNSWDTRRMESELGTMRKIVEKAQWNEKEQTASKELAKNLQELAKIVQEKDATRVDAAHTHVDEALSSLQDLVFGI
jgi:hypothetical protein